MKVKVFKVPQDRPDDISYLDALVRNNQLDPSKIVAILGKTEGNGCVNDFTRGFATQTLKYYLQTKTARNTQEQIVYVMSGGTEGVLSPHLTVFTWQEDDPNEPLATQAMTLGLFAGAAQAKQFRLPEATIADIHAAMKSGNLTCRTLVQQYLNRIEAYDKKGPALNSIIMMNPKALAMADELDAKFAKSGFIGPLHCIPVILKDNFDTSDMPTTGGSLTLKDSIPPNDAFITRKLKAAGAIVLAKANLHEFAVWGETVSSLGGQTRNPYDLTRTPGGSSGGTGSAIAANFGAVGMGTDTVNSIRSPASACSLVGFRPTMGLVSRDGVIPYSLTQDMAGPITRTVADAAVVLEAIAGYDSADPVTAWSVGLPQSYTAFLKPNGLKGARIGVLQNFFGSGPEHTEVNAVVNAAIEEMKKQGASVVPVNIPDLDANKLVSDASVHLYELKAHLQSYLASLGPNTPVKTLEDIIASGKYSPSIEDSLKKAQSLSINDPEYKERLLKGLAVQQSIMKVMADNNLDALVYPHQKRLVVPIGESQVERNGVLGSVTGFPAITVPAGFSPRKESAPIGVPIGIEFMGRPWSEPTLLKLAYSFEQATKYRRPPVTLPNP